MLTLRTRRNISLVLFICLLLVSAAVWSMTAEEEGLKDGVYSGSAQGFKGTVTLDVTISGGKITEVQVRPHQETPALANPAIAALIEKILETQSSEVEVISGATYTSKAVIEAAEKALIKAAGNFPDGVYRGSAQGFKSTITVEVTVAKGALTQVEVVEHDDTPAIAQKALDQIPHSIVEAQSWEVEAVSGATRTSEGIMTAVKNALE